MEYFIQIIGSIASIGGIPLAIYLYIKSKENQFDKIKREIIRVLSFQIGEERQISSFEIDSVIKSKLKENRLSINKISITDVIEDLTTTTIASPLLDSNKKQIVLEQLKSIHLKGKLFDHIESLDFEKITEDEINSLAKEFVAESKQSNSKNQDNKEKLSSQFGAISIILTIISFVTFFVGQETFDNYLLPEGGNEILFGYKGGIITSVVLSILTLIITYFLRKKENKKQ